MVLEATIPLVKFQTNNVCIDLIFADFLTPKSLKDCPDNYLENPSNIGPYNQKSFNCLHSYQSMLELKRLLANLSPQNPSKPLQVFSRVCRLIKCFCQRREIYSFKLGYLNGIGIMIMVCYIMS